MQKIYTVQQRSATDGNSAWDLAYVAWNRAFRSLEETKQEIDLERAEFGQWEVGKNQLEWQEGTNVRWYAADLENDTSWAIAEAMLNTNARDPEAEANGVFNT